MNYCKKCESEVDGVLSKDGFCSACVEAVARGKAQTEAIESGKLKTAKAPKKGK